MKPGAKRLLFLIVAAFVLFCDSQSKTWLGARLAFSETLPIIPDFFHLTLIENRGAAFGLLKESEWLFAVSGIFVIIIVIFVLSQSSKLLKGQIIAIGMITGGAAGNFIDRFMYGAVLDFIDFRGIWPFIFNIADAAIVSGCILFAIYYVLSDYRKVEIPTRFDNE